MRLLQRWHVVDRTEPPGPRTIVMDVRSSASTQHTSEVGRAAQQQIVLAKLHKNTPNERRCVVPRHGR